MEKKIYDIVCQELERGEVGYGEADDVCDYDGEPEWRFPFVTDFSHAARGKIGAEVLGKLLASTTALVARGQKTIDSLKGAEVLSYSQAVLARLRVQVVVYVLENVVVGETAAERECCMRELFYKSAAEARIPVVEQTGRCVGAPKTMLDAMWVHEAMRCMLPYGDMCRLLACVASPPGMVKVANALVWRGDVHDRPVDPVDFDLPVVSLIAWRDMITYGGPASARELLELTGPPEGLPMRLYCSDDVALAWLWLLRSVSSEDKHGYCYQLWEPPRDRYALCREYGTRISLEQANERVWPVWATRDSRCVLVGDGQYHVSEPGNCVLPATSEGYIAGPADSEFGEPDYFARGLVDAFIRERLQVVQPPPSDQASKLVAHKRISGESDPFAVLSDSLYSSIGLQMSPGLRAAKLADFPLAVMPSGVVREPDRDVLPRLWAGAAISERYFEARMSRARQFRRWPKLPAADGRSVHVFDRFVVTDHSRGDWDGSDIPDVGAWHSYVRRFKAGTTTNVRFSTGRADPDVRMDCTGDGVMRFGDCEVVVSGTVLWFSESVMFTLVAGKSVTLRVSWPERPGVLAVARPLRDLLRYDGFTYMLESHSVPDTIYDKAVHFVRGSTVAGSSLSSASVRLSAGKRVLRFYDIPDMKAVRCVLSSEPTDALRYVELSGVEFRPSQRGYVSVTSDLRLSNVYVSVAKACVLNIAVACVVDKTAFDSAVEVSTSIRADAERLD